MRAYCPRAIATALPAGLSVEQVVTGGNLILATIAALLAVLAGRWALRKTRLEAETAELNKARAELELQRELGRGATITPFPPQAGQ